MRLVAHTGSSIDAFICIWIDTPHLTLVLSRNRKPSRASCLLWCAEYFPSFLEDTEASESFGLVFKVGTAQDVWQVEMNMKLVIESVLTDWGCAVYDLNTC